MGLDLWFREDVARILAATHETMLASFQAAPPASPEQADTYRQGFFDALRAVAIAFGVAEPHGGGQQRAQTLIAGRNGHRNWSRPNDRGP